MCKEFEEKEKESSTSKLRVLGGRDWPEKVNANVNMLTEMSKKTVNNDFDFEDGVISPKEFDAEFEQLDDTKIAQLMTDVLTHPKMYTFS